MSTQNEQGLRTKITVRVDSKLEAALREHQAELRKATGVNASLSQAASSLMRLRLQELKPQAG